VQFKVDGTNLGFEVTTSPYTTSWDSTKVANGSHTITAVARDTSGNTTTSSSVSVTTSNVVDTTKPTVSLTAPTAGSTVSNTAAVSATAADNVGVAGVQFKLDGANLQAEDTTSPYSINWNTATATNGAHTLTAVARDAAGNTTTSSAVSVTVTNTGVYLSDLTWTAATSGYGPPEKDMSNGENLANDGKTITLNGVTYTKGLGVHAASDITYNLGGTYSTFTSDVGVDDEIATGGSVVFQVFLDGVKAYDSGTMTSASATKSISLSVAGKNQLRVVVTDSGDGNTFDHADWASAKLTLAATGPKTGDINGDNSVNITDLSFLLSSYGQNTTQCVTNTAYKCDLSSPADGIVNIFDMSILLSNYGK
jgi:hypothetical protein